MEIAQLLFRPVTRFYPRMAAGEVVAFLLLPPIEGQAGEEAGQAQLEQ